MSTWLLVWGALALATVTWAQDTVPLGYRAYSLRHRTAVDVAQQVRGMIAGIGGDSQVLVDAEGNRLLVQGSPEAQRLTTQLVQALDQPVAQRAEPPAADPHVEVRSYAVDGDLEAAAARLRAQYPLGSGTRIAVDPRAQRLIVVAPPAVQRAIQQSLPAAAQNQLPPNAAPVDAPAAASPDFHQLQHLSWREFEDALRQLLAGRVRMTTARNGELATVMLDAPSGPQAVMQIDRRLDRVMFDGNQPGAQAWKLLAQAIDSPATVDRQIELVPVRNADPIKIKTAVSLMRSTADQGDAEPAAAAAVPLGGTRRSAPLAAPLLAKIFQQNGQPLGGPQPPAAGAQPQPPLPPGQPGGEGMADEGAGGLIGPVQIEFLEGLDVIIIRGRRRDVERVRRMIEEIEQLSAETQPVIEVYHLNHINDEAAVTLISELYEEILAPRQGQVSIRALVDPNAILLIGRAESITIVKDLIAKLDQPSAPSSRFEIFRLKYLSALDAEQTVRNFFVNRPGTDTEPRVGTGVQVKIIADYRTNALIVQASPRDLSEIRRLLENIDVQEGDARFEIRVFRLKNALAADLAEVLLGAIRGESGTPGAAQQLLGAAPGAAATQTQSQARQPAASLQLMLIDQERGELLRSGIMDDVQVTADPNINALIVRAPSESMNLIKALIAELDQLPDAEAVIKVFTMLNGDATNLAAMLQQLFGLQVTAGQGNAQFPFGIGQQPQLAAGETSLVPLSFAIDVRTNSIIASGGIEDLRVVETLLVRLDEADIAARQLTVIRLKNAPALDVANSITTFLTSQRQLIQQQLLFNQAISPYEQIEREVIVVPEVVTNSLIVSATPRYYEEIIQVIRDLDFRPPMVMVQVVIAEVALDDVFELGVELGLQDSLLYERGLGAFAPANDRNPGFNFLDENQFSAIGSPGLPNNVDTGPGRLAGQAISALGLGRTSSLAGVGYGGLVLSAASESINALVRALEQNGRLQILSRPQIMALNNQQAFVQVGSDVARITGTTITGTGVVQQNVEDVQTGLILRIQPLINDDGVVILDIDAERSRLGEVSDGTPIGTDEQGNPIVIPPIDRTTAQTTISAKSGQTVVFAGLMTDRKVALERKVPLLGDVPVLGNLFRFESDEHEKTELLIIMTPYIVDDDEDYEMIKMLESQRMTWCLGDVVTLHGDVGLQGGPCLFGADNVPMLFPDLDPTGAFFKEQLIEVSPQPVPDASSRRDTSLEPVPVTIDPVQFQAPAAPPAMRLPAPAAPQAVQPASAASQAYQAAPYAPLQPAQYQYPAAGPAWPRPPAAAAPRR